MKLAATRWDDHLLTMWLEKNQWQTSLLVTMVMHLPLGSEVVTIESQLAGATVKEGCGLFPPLWAFQ